MSETNEQWQLYICRACGLIYDEREGDPDSGLAPGTRFEDIPEDWECPLCGVTKSDFELFQRPVIDGTAQLAVQHKKGVIIIGAGIAGWAMAEAIRRINSSLPITLITACEGDVYHKPELSIAIARGQRAADLVREHASDSAKRLGVNLLPKTFVVGICSVTKSVRTTRGTFEYENLVLAQGAKAYQPEQIPAEWCWRVNHLTTWKELQQRLAQRSQRIAIVGGGLVGCELAENLCRAGHHVNFIYRSPTLLPSLLPSGAGIRLKDQLESQGVLCWQSTDVQHVQRLDSIYKMQLSSGKVIEVDQIITATGLVTDDRLARKAGLEFNNGISVNPETLRSSQPNIFALGDCISLVGSPCRFIAPITTQAQVIAEQIASPSETSSKPTLYRHQAPTIRVKVQSCSLVIRGQPAAQGEWQTLHNDEQQLTMEQYLEGRLISRLEFAIAS